MHRLWIPGPLPGLNEIINARGVRYRGGANGYSSLKKRWSETVSLLAASQKFPKLEKGHFVYLWREPTKRRDPSNFTAGGRKIIEDALQQSGFLAGDGWKNVFSFQDEWLVDAKRPGVTVFVTDVRVHSPIEMWVEQDEARHDSVRSRP